MTFKEDFKPTKVYNKLVNDVCYNADCLEEFEKQRLVVANPFSYNKSTRTGIVAEFDNGYHLSKEVGIKRNFVTIGMRVWDIIRKNRYAVIISFIGYIAENIKFNSNVIYISHDLIKGYGLVKPNYRDYYNAIAYLEDENIIKRTNLQNIYVVNPIYIFRGDVNKLINIISEAKLIKTFDDKDRLIIDKFVLFKNDTDKGIVIANKDLYATEVIDISEDWVKCDDKNDDNYKDEGEDNGNNEDEGNKGNDNENEMKSYNESDSENDSNGNNENENKNEKMIKIIIMMMKRVKVIMNMKVMMIANIRIIKVVIMRMKIVYINVLMRLVSIRGGSLNWTWLPPSSSRRK